MESIADEAALEACWAASEEGPVFIFKHSTACPVSASAKQRVDGVLADPPAHCPAVYLVKVIESRAVSNAIADQVGVRHQSPQLILVKDGEAVWDASHHTITGAAMVEAIQQHVEIA